MNFNKFWTQLKSQLNSKMTFTTLKQNKEFDAYFDRNKNDDLFVQVIPESGKPRGPIHANEFQGVWDNLQTLPNDSIRFINKNGRLNSYTKQDGSTGTSQNLSYIIALIKHIVKKQDIQ